MPLNGMERLEGCSQWNSMPGYDAPVKPHPEQPVCREKPKPTFALPPEDGDLVPQGDKLKFQAGAATKAEGKKRNESGKIVIMPRTVWRWRENLQPFSTFRSFEQPQHTRDMAWVLYEAHEYDSSNYWRPSCSFFGLRAANSSKVSLVSTRMPAMPVAAS
jgi:hypothetical protein